jgi:hypothetical protein
MQQWTRAIARVLLAVALLPLFGCSLSFLTVRISDFESKQVRGIWVWRRSEQTGQYLKDTQLVFGTLVKQAQGELLLYTTTYGPLGERGALSTGLARDASNQNIVTMQVAFLRRSAPGTFKVTTYNAIGDSPLSDQSDFL